jgi:hypothetical protein
MSDSVCTGETQSRFWDSSLAPTKKKKKKLLEQKLFDDKQGARSESREQAKVTKRKIDVQGGHWAAQGWYKKKEQRTTSFSLVKTNYHFLQSYSYQQQHERQRTNETLTHQRV